MCGNCREYKKQALKVILRIVNTISFSTKLHSADMQGKCNELGVLQIRQLFYFVVLTRYYYSNEYKSPVKKHVTLRKVERSVTPWGYTNFGIKMRNYHVAAIFNDIPDDLCLASNKRKMMTDFKRCV